MANYVFIAESLDGFIATASGGINWLNEIPNPDKSDFGYNKFISNIDAIVMGRISFEKVLTFDEWIYPKPVFVLSNTLEFLNENLSGKAEIIKGDIRNIISRLNQAGYKNLYIDGGKTIQSFLRENLIDEMIITRVPVLLGSGITLFGNIDRKINFDHIRTEVLNNHLVQSCYKKSIK
ncbi:MAG: dihydrofolate reductase family protein [Melioribacteraceae bacterium]|nr:dihydrofolate reductase family protein [Melioribacteraceae bacterium]MCF8356688.1 dihydrofolate reductase family protein [Melioribacteraceae bacterium]MCF8395558.1 dihydrofolate reductase family protein [Melioribacteraceae bacterium]MCF8420858.1 dihydrofolate reductase family protein [Melioribacteraceae bacterium]